MNKKEYLIITERFYPEEFLINELVQEWDNKGMHLSVLTQTPTYPYGKTYSGFKNKFYYKQKWGNTIIKRFFCITGYRENRILKILSFINFVFLTSIYAVIKGKKYDKIFVYQVGALTVALPAILIKLLYNKKVTIWTQDIWPDTVSPSGFNGFKKGLLLKFLNKFVYIVYKNCDEIIVSCEPFIEKINRFVPEKEIHYLPNWPSITFNEELNSKHLSDKFNFTFAGNINKWRNLETIIKCFNIYNKDTNKSQLNIIGDGSGLDSLIKYVDKNNIEGVKFWGRKPSADMGSFYEGSDVLIISLAPNPCYSLYLPAKFSTYLTTRKPIYAIMNGAVPDLMKNYDVGVYVAPDNENEIINGFKRLAELNNNDIHCFKNNSKKLLADEFNKKDIINKLTEISFS